MGAFGCLALELREAAPRVRGRNHRLNWSCQEGPLEPLKAGLPNSYNPDSHHAAKHSCVCACMWEGCREALLHPAWGRGMQGAQIERVKDFGFPSSHSPNAAPSLGTRRFYDE